MTPAGVIDTASLGHVMRAIGLEPSDAELKNMITEVDGSGKGAVDFAEVRGVSVGRALTGAVHEDDGQERTQHGQRDQGDLCHLQRQRQARFRTHARSLTPGSGKISVAELKSMMGKFGEAASDQARAAPWRAC